MSTQTQTIRKLPVQPGRTHDYLYDKVHVLASERDHARATFKAHTGTSRVKQVPIYQTMFSELRHYPRFQMRLDVTDPVPQFVSRQWPGYQDQHRESVIRYKTFNYAPHLKLSPVHYENANVTGVNRYKYFRRPIIPFLQQVPPDVVLATALQDTYGPQDTFIDRPPTPLTRTVEIQTDYRDGEAQTDPYTPEYVIRPGEQPELLTLATLSYGRGLPAGLAEVEMIERARAKRAWEATLPPLNDVSQLEKRQKMMDEMETKEWALREQEIEKLQATRLEVLKQLLRQREENQQNLNIRRLDKIWSIKQEEKDKRVKQIRKEHIKAIRKLTKRRREVEGKLERRDIVHDLSDPGSQAYAPLTRVGVFLDRGSEQYVVKSRYLNSYQGLLELEQSLPTYVLNPRINAPKPKTCTKTGFIRRQQRQEQELRELHEVIKEMKNKEEEQPKSLRFLQKIEQPVPRPPTPAVDVPSEEDEEQELAVIFLQKIIRGRAIQNMMFEGKEKRSELIKELRSTHALQEAEQQVKKQDKQATLALQRQRRLHEQKESFVDENLAQLEGDSVGSMLEFLTKELIRLQEERRIHAFAMLAERQRRLREAEESGRRQMEERRRREHDEIFKQVTKVHQLTVDTYLENIILDAIDSTADEQARGEVQEMANKINDIAYEVEESRNKLESEEIVSELIHCFLLPEAEKSTLRERVNRHQRKYLLAAHNEIHKDGSTVIDDHKNPDVASSAHSSRAGDRSGSKASLGSKHSDLSETAERSGSQAGTSGSQAERSVSQAERSGSQAERSGSAAERSGSQAERSASAAERSGSQAERSASQAERSGSAAERSGSATEKPESIAPDEVAPQTGEPGSRPSSQTNQPASRKVSQASQADDTGSKHSSRKSSVHERSASQQSLQGKVPTPVTSPVQSQTGSRQQEVRPDQSQTSSHRGSQQEVRPDQSQTSSRRGSKQEVRPDQSQTSSRRGSQQEVRPDQSQTSSRRGSKQEVRPSSVQSQVDGIDEVVEPEIAQLQGSDDSEPQGEGAERASSQTSQKSGKAPSPDRPASKGSKHSDVKGSRSSSRQSPTEKPSSKPGSRPASAGSRHGSDKSAGSRKSSSGKVDAVDLSIEGKSSPSGSKPPSRHSSTASVRSGKQSPAREGAPSRKTSQSSTHEKPASRKSSDAKPPSRKSSDAKPPSRKSSDASQDK